MLVEGVFCFANKWYNTQTMDQASQIRGKIDLVALISEFIPLRKMGRNFKANCPFHGEKTPSFVVSPERQIWHCFGCGKGGDCFTFLMEYEQLEFIEALKTLGKRVGVEVEYSSLERGVSSQKEKIYRMNKLAADFYHYVLTRHNAGKKALDYLASKRKINPKIIETFLLGFAPTSRDVLSRYLTDKKGFKRQDLVDAGLSAIRNGNLTDFFFNRIMFPLFDHRGNIIGFSGRTMDDSSDISKYVNTRDTLAYHKGEVFFGLNIAKEEIKKEGEVIIMEGEFDVISSYQEGVGNVVAVKGTALTDSQVHLISRFAPKVILSFDQDKAGFDALKRSLPILEKRGLATHVLVLPNGKDPDEAIKKSPLDYKKAVKHPIDVYDFLLEKNVELFDKKSVEGKKKISEELIPILANIENEILKEHYLKKLAAELEVSLESIYRQMEKIKKQETQLVTKTSVTKDTRIRSEILEQYILSLILQSEDPKQSVQKSEDVLVGFSFVTASFEKLFDSLISFFSKNTSFDSERFTKQLPKELLSSFDACYLFPLPKFDSKDDYERELTKSLENLKEFYIREKIRNISERIKLKEKETYEEKETDLEKMNEELSSFISMLGMQN